MRPSAATVDDPGGQDPGGHRENRDGGDQELEAYPEVEHHIGDGSGDDDSGGDPG